MKTKNYLYIGDSRERIQEIRNDSIGLVVTSPPYWNIKDYDAPDQIGFGQTYKEYISSLKTIWQGCFDVLIPGCRLVVNVGDQFVRAKDNNGVYEILPIHADIIKSCQDLGYIFLGNIIWEKITTTKTTGGCVWMGSIYYPRDGYVTYEHEYILLFKKPGKAPRPTEKNKKMSRLSKEERSKWFRGIWDDLPPARQEGHCAMFPEELAKRIIKMFSFAGDTVLDPFVGSGTTMKAAMKLHRNSIGIEINEEYLGMIKEKIPNLCHSCTDKQTESQNKKSVMV